MSVLSNDLEDRRGSFRAEEMKGTAEDWRRAERSVFSISKNLGLGLGNEFGDF